MAYLLTKELAKRGCGTVHLTESGAILMRETAIVVGIVVVSTLGSAYARVGAEYLRWASGEFEMPPAIREAKDRNQLESFFQSSSEFLRMAAVRRLGEVEGPKAAELLRELARKERSPKGPDYVPLVKLEVIRVLNTMQANEAESALIGLFNDYWARRTAVQRDRAFRLYDFHPVASVLLDALERRSNSKVVFGTLEGPALSRDVADRGSLPDWFRQRVWEVYLRSQMIHSGALAEADQVEGLLDQLNLVDRQWPFGYLSLNHIKALAARRAIERYDDNVLRAVDARLDQVIRTKAYEKAADPMKRRQELTDNRSYIQKVLQDHVDASKTPTRGPSQK
ncbi:MAG: hypothetical protein JW955_10085 [Sedimentisphaerales bacterium]|nr:hypothetical protein [Sedimentisphaerales bacterium]